MNKSPRKFTSVLIAIMIVLTSALPAVSAATTPVKVGVSDVTVERGKDFQIDVTLDDIPLDGITFAGFGIEFDSDYIKITDADITEGPISTQSGAWQREKGYFGDLDVPNVFQASVAGDIIRIEWVTGLTLADKAYFLHNSGVLCSIKGNLSINTPGDINTFDFKIVKPAANDVIAFGFTDDNDVATEYAYTAKNGTLTIAGKAVTPNAPPDDWPNINGDLDGDGEVASTDIIQMIKYQAGKIGSAIQIDGKPTWHSGMTKCADTFHEEITPYVAKVNSRDLLALIQKVFGTVKTLPQYGI